MAQRNGQLVFKSWVEMQEDNSLQEKNASEEGIKNCIIRKNN